MTEDMHAVVELRLKDAGRTIMMLPVPPRGRPGGAQAAWVDVVQTYWDVMGSTPDEENTLQERQEALERLRNEVKLHASTKQVARLDEVLEWLWMIPAGLAHPPHRKAVVARMLTNPHNGKPVYSWRRIATALSSSENTVKCWHHKGVHFIVEGLAGK